MPNSAEEHQTSDPISAPSKDSPEGPIGGSSEDLLSVENADFQRGLNEFNTGQFYACHDTLEAIWMGVDHAEKPFYQGILQIAVAFYHLGNLNWRGGAILLGEGLNRLRKFEPGYEGVDVENLVDQAVEWLELVQEAGETGLAAIMEQPPLALPKVRAYSELS